ncbi:MAG: 8-oxo-dGTP diphosphatase [Clostridia bacterium]|nr:8-oxo-dGTP diphosphatase [Clostridia bacterium]
MKNTTLCYIHDGQGRTLLLHRIKKNQDLNHDKWIGVGGKFEENESPEECLIREVLEETGLTLTDYHYRGVVTFVSAVWENELMHLFTAHGFEGTVKECDEGALEWIDDEVVPTLPTWEGDRIFLELLEQDIPFFSLKLEYDAEETLISAILNGQPLRWK